MSPFSCVAFFGSLVELFLQESMEQCRLRVFWIQWEMIEDKCRISYFSANYGMVHTDPGVVHMHINNDH